MGGTLPVVCPRCGKSGSVPATYVGRDIHCKKCDAHFIVQGPAEGPAQAGMPGRVPSPVVTAPLAHAVASDHPHEHFAPGPPQSAPSSSPIPSGPSLIDHLRDAVPTAPPPPSGPSLLDNLRDSAELSPLSDDDVLHAKQRYEARVLAKDRVAHYDDHGNLLSEAEYEERKRQGRGSVH